MTLSEISIRRPVFAWMLMVGLILFGAIAFSRMGVSQMPDVDFPTITVSVSYDGASPEVMELNVVDPLEDAVMTVEGVRTVSSSSRYGSATVTLEFDLAKNINTALQEVQTKVAQAQRSLPKDIDSPVITKSNPEDQPIMWLSISSDKMSLRDLNIFVRDQIKDQFSAVPGVGDVFLGGYVEPNLRVWISNKKLNQFELTVGDILDTVSDQHNELPAGQIQSLQKEYDIRTLGEARTAAEFEKLPILARGGRPNYRPLQLSEVARVEEGLAEVRRLSRANGKPAVGLGILKQRGTNAVSVANAVKVRVEELKTRLPAGTEIGINFDSTRFIKESVGELNFTLILSALLTALVCWLFLASLSSTFNVLLAIPTAIIGTFMVLYFLGFTLNTFTLLGLSLAIGIVVDDAIMVLENIVRHREMGKTRFQAAIDGAKEITFAATAATISIVAIFLPVAFMRGVIGAFFLQFGVTLTAAVLLSLLEALTLTPMRCSQFVDKSSGHSRFGRFVDDSFRTIADTYARLLSWCLAHRARIVVGSLILFAVSLLAIRWIPKEFMPAQDQSSFLIRAQSPVGSSLEYTDTRLKEAEKILLAQPEVSRIYVAIGGFGGGEVNTGMIFLTMKPKGERGIRDGRSRELSQADFMDLCRKTLSSIQDLKIFIQDLSMRGFSSSRGFPLEFSIRGPEWSTLGESAEKILEELRATGLVDDLDSDYQMGKPEIQVIPDREKAARYGVSIRSISETIQASVGGIARGKYNAGGRRYDIRLRLESDERNRAEQIKDLWVRNNRGEPVRLADVVHLSEKPGLQKIARYNRERSVGIFGNPKAGLSQDTLVAKVSEIAKRVLPENYHLVMSGSAKTFDESFRDLFFALVLGLIVAYMVLASQFNSFIHPITVLMALPFSITGAFVALWITNQSLNIFSFIGIILLMGIVKKNSILLVEFTNHVRAEEELSVREALLKACPIRLRPILMTSFATIAGAIPPALAFGPGAETRVPMAVTIIGGVLVSTILTLVVVPCVYSLFEDLILKWHKRKTMKSFKGACALFLCCLLTLVIPLATPLVTSLSAAPSSEALSLREALEVGLSTNASLRVAQQEHEKQKAKAREALAQATPDLSGSFSYSRMKDANDSERARFSGDPFNFYEGQLKASQVLFQRGFFEALSAARKNRSLSEIDLALTKRQITQSIINAFFQVILHQNLVTLFKHLKTLQEQSLEVAQKRSRSGRGQELDVLQIQTQLALLEPKIQKAESDSIRSREELAITLGNRDLRHRALKGELNISSLRKWAEKVKGQESDTVLELIRFEREREKLLSELTVTLGKHWPQITADATLGRSGTKKGIFLDDDATTWSLGVNLEVPLFHGFAYFFERQSLEASVAQLDAREREKKDEIAKNLVTSEQNLITALSAADSSLRAYELAGRALKLARNDYRVANIDYLALLTTERNLFDAEQSLEQAKYDSMARLIDYAIAKGHDLEPLLEDFGD